MDTMIKERCIYCGGDVYYHGGESLIKCDWCGQTLVVTQFENELVRIKKTEEENILIREQLEGAEKEKEAANDRLFAALSSFGEIRNEQDTLGKVLHLMADDQQDVLTQLQFMKNISGKILNSQTDIIAQMDVMNEVRSRLQAGEISQQEQRAALMEFMTWNQNIREEDIRRLQDISEKADSLYAVQTEMREKAEQLQRSADQHQKTLEAFHSQYQRDKLEKIQNLYRQAQQYQFDWEFEKAEESYREILVEGGEDSEIYWRILICHYGLTYQQNDEGEWVPVILNPDLTDPGRMSVRRDLQQHMDEKNRSYYESELRKIDRILDSYREVRHDWQFDVFISVKQSVRGNYTSDRNTGLDIYNFLKAKGLRVFNSEATKLPSGDLYEPYIISALLSAKVMIVVGSSKENMESQWIKNEWSRFQWLQHHDRKLTGKTDRKLLCYLTNGMQPRDIPRGLDPNRQAIIDGVRAHDALLEVVESIKGTAGKEAEYAKTEQETAPEDESLIKNQMTLWLVMGEYEKVIGKYEQLISNGLFLTNVPLHLMGLCARQGVPDINQVVNSSFDLEQAQEYKDAVRFCQNKAEKQKLREMLAQNKKWREEAASHEELPKQISRKAEDQPAAEKPAAEKYAGEKPAARKAAEGRVNDEAQISPRETEVGPTEKSRESDSIKQETRAKKNDTETEKKKKNIFGIIAPILIILIIIVVYVSNILTKSKAACEEYLPILQAQVDHMLSDSDILQKYGVNQVDYKVSDMKKDFFGNTYSCEVVIEIDGTDDLDDNSRQEITDSVMFYIPQEVLELPSGNILYIQSKVVKYSFTPKDTESGS